MRIYIFASLIWLHTLTVSGQGVIRWNESVNGSLGNSAGNASSLGILGVGTNSIIGRVEAVPFEFGWTGTNDFFTFTVPNGSSLVGVYLTVHQQILAWLGDGSFASEMGYRFTSTSENLLPYFGGRPLPAGSYGMYISNYDLKPVPTFADYGLDFVLSPVPEPSTWALLALGAGAFRWLGRAAALPGQIARRIP